MGFFSAVTLRRVFLCNFFAAGFFAFFVAIGYLLSLGFSPWANQLAPKRLHSACCLVLPQSPCCFLPGAFRIGAHLVSRDPVETLSGWSRPGAACCPISFGPSSSPLFRPYAPSIRLSFSASGAACSMCNWPANSPAHIRSLTHLVCVPPHPPNAFPAV